MNKYDDKTYCSRCNKVSEDCRCLDEPPFMGYVLQPQPDEEAVLNNGVMLHPVATLKDGHGGISHIVVDDHCYVLVNGSSRGGAFKMSYHWYREAAEVMKLLPIPT